MRVAHLRSFYAAARYGGFTAGARQLHVSQPTVTTQVRALEAGYGVELFHRHGHRLVLSDVGQQLFGIAQRIFGLEEDAVHLLADSGTLRTGKLRVGAVGPYHVMEMIAAFRQKYPGVEVTIRIGNSEETVRGLLELQTDVAVLAQYARDARLHFVPYRSHPLLVFVPKRHRYARRASIAIEQLAGEPLVMRESGSTTRKVFDDALRKAGVVPRSGARGSYPRPRHRRGVGVRIRPRPAAARADDRQRRCAHGYARGDAAGAPQRTRGIGVPRRGRRSFAGRGDHAHGGACDDAAHAQPRLTPARVRRQCSLTRGSVRSRRNRPALPSATRVQPCNAARCSV